MFGPKVAQNSSFATYSAHDGGNVDYSYQVSVGADT